MPLFKRRRGKWMSFRIKASMLSLIAIGALGGTVTAQATAFEFHSEDGHTILQAPQVGSHKLTFGSGFGAVACKSIVTSATSAALTQTELSAITLSSGCEDSLGRVVHISNNSCETRFHATEKVSATRFAGSADLICPAGTDKVVIVTGGGGGSNCTATVQPQENIGPIEFENTGSQVNIILNATNIKSTTSGGFFACGLANGEHSEGTYTGTSLVSGKTTAGNAVKIWVG
jgi:hypothetical protein